MSHSLKVRLIGALLLVIASIGVFGIVPISSLLTNRSGNIAHAASLPYHKYANGPYKVQGNTVIGADGTPYLFHGVGRDSLEFYCPGNPGLFDYQHLALMGPTVSGGMSGGTYWYGNTVRLPLSEGFWLNGFAGQNCTATQYQATVKQIVDTLKSLNLNVILDLQWTDATDATGHAQSLGGGATWQVADTDSVKFWQQVAGIYTSTSYPNVLFELFNEPHPLNAQGYDWACWQQGCQVTNEQEFETYCNCQQTYSYKGVGMQALVNAVRGTGNTNLVLVAGVDWGFDLSQLGSFPITGSNIVYDTHPYGKYAEKQPSFWDNAFGKLSATAPVISAESGVYDCTTSYMTQLMNYFDSKMIGWVAWAWYTSGNASDTYCGYPELIQQTVLGAQDFNGTPVPGMGAFLYQRLLSYANQVPPSPGPSPTPTLPPVSGPVNKLWYFAEGRVGGGFKEFLTLGNPTNNACQVNITYLASPDSGGTQTKVVSLSVPANQRVTEWVDGDLGTSPTGPGISDSAIVTVNATATPNCTGIVAERPMYFNALGVNSGSDVVGITHTGTAFYFADMAVGSQPGGGSYASFLPILNPGTSAATVTATYYANGQQVGTQTATVAPGTRGTIFPSQAIPALPHRVSVTLSSNQPVVIERPTYFSNIQGGNSGVVSGAADVVGVQTLANDWLFAEGYTGGQFQENFVIANLDPGKTQANVTINLEYTDGTSHTFPVTVNSLSQLIWNVNTNGAGAPSQSVSAEITSTGAKIVVEREMFFKYNHVGNGRTLIAAGGTDIVGQVGPAAASDYSFAEGYTNVGYDEWLTMQNPTANAETITVTLVNAKGTVYTFSAQVVAHSRYTVDIVATVIQHVYHNGDGYQGYEISMAVQSSGGAFVVERPMYWNASGTQGGSDVIGYSGG